MTQKIVYRVAVRENELSKLCRRSLVKSEYGHRNLFDSCDWRPYTTKDYLIDVIKNPIWLGKSEYDYLQNWIRSNKTIVYLAEYRGWDLRFIGEKLHIKPLSGPSQYEPFGIAVLTKTKNK
jgi:Zn-dependent oligopeptidase